MLQNESPYCELIRISVNLSDPGWTAHLKRAGFSKTTPTFWILEGLVYYLEKDEVASILMKSSELSEDSSEIFVDICIPALAG
jgi:O-methyltransferase involved in polyketide biosynthesis